MTKPKRRPDQQPSDLARVTPDEAHAAARLVAARYPNDPSIARELLDALGLLPPPWEKQRTPPTTGPF